MASNGSGPMRIELRRDNPGQPWGFRLQGGIDFPTALSIQSVNPGSIAERFGIMAGDAVLQINNKSSDQLEHEQAKQEIIASGNNVFLVLQRGAVKIWKPKVTPMSELRPKELNQVGDYDNEPYIQKTSLAADKQEVHHIGSAHNRAARPFQGFGGGGAGAAPGGQGTVPAIVNAQYNSPINLYSTENTVDTFKTQSNMLTANMEGLDMADSGSQSQSSSSSLAPPTMTSLADNEQFSSTPANAVKVSGGNSPNVFRRASPVRFPATRLADNDEAIQNQKSAVIKELKKADDAADGKSYQSNISGGGAKQSRSFQMLQAELGEIDASVGGGSNEGDRPAGIRSVKAPVYDPSQHEVKQASLMTCKICGSLCVGVFVRIKGDPIHPECFKCCRCGVNLKNQGYFHIEGQMYCEIHAKQVAKPGPGMQAQVVYR